MSESVVAVVLSFNSWPTLVSALDAVAAQTAVPVRTIVVDNGSSDGTPERLRMRSGIEVIALARNVGVGAGHNAGWRSVLEGGSPGGWIWVLEHDNQPAPNCLERLLTTAGKAAAHGPVGAVFPGQVRTASHLPPDGDPSMSARLHFNGALLATDALRAVGLAREDFWCGQEDRELGLRLGAAGWLTVFDPGAVVVHPNFGNGTGARSTVFRRYYGWRNDLWVRAHVRREGWVRTRAVGAAAVTVARSVRTEPWPWPLARARVRATVDALSGRLGPRAYPFLTQPVPADRHRRE